MHLPRNLPATFGISICADPSQQTKDGFRAMMVRYCSVAAKNYPDESRMRRA